MGLEELDITQATPYDPTQTKASRKHYRKSRKRAKLMPGNTRMKADVRAGKRLPPAVPKNKSLVEIADMDPDSPEFKHPTGFARRTGAIEADDPVDDWKDRVRADKQHRANERRGRARKAEAVTSKAVEVLESTNPKRQRTKSMKEMEVYDEDRAIAEGILDLDDWDDEELIRGYRRNRNHLFGKPPAYIPREVQQELFRRIVHRGDRKMRAAYLKSIEALVELTEDGSGKVRLDAIKELMSRVVGKVPDRVHISGEASPWESSLMDSVVPISELPAIDMQVGEDGVARVEPIHEGDNDD